MHTIHIVVFIFTFHCKVVAHHDGTSFIDELWTWNTIVDEHRSETKTKTKNKLSQKKEVRN